MNRRGKLIVVAAVVAVFSLVGWFEYRNKPVVSKDPVPSASQEPTPLKPFIDAPDFLLADLQGNQVNLAAYRDSVVLLEFWATW